METYSRLRNPKLLRRRLYPGCRRGSHNLDPRRTIRLRLLIAVLERNVAQFAEEVPAHIVWVFRRGRGTTPKRNLGAISELDVANKNRGAQTMFVGVFDPTADVGVTISVT